MNAGRLLVALYPAPVRDRWGSELTTEIAHHGRSGWVDTALGAVRLWLQPAAWPETTAGQARRTVVGFAVAIVVAAALGARGLGPAGLSPDRPATAVWVATVGAGLAVLAPLPRPRPAALARLIVYLARAAALPVAALTALVVLANSGLVGHPGVAERVALLAYYWATLVLAGVRACTAVARLGPDLVRLPSLRRIQAGLLTVAGGLAVGAAEIAATVVTGGRLATGGLTVVVFVFLTALAVRAVRDLGDRVS